MSEMRTTPLPPTWMVVSTTVTDQHATREYANRVTGERTPEHPGTSYFVAAVESERRRNRHQGQGRSPVVSTSSPQAISGNNSSDSSSASIGAIDCRLSSSTLGQPRQEGGSGSLVSTLSANGDSMDDGQAISAGSDSTR